MGAYSFQDVSASIAGVGGVFPLGSGSGAAEEGITVEMTEDKNTMTIGADGSGMHSLHAGKSATVTVRLLKTSPVNAQLGSMYSLQTASAAAHGKNVILIQDVSRGDVITCSEVAFAKAPAVNYAKDGGTNEWVFHAVSVSHLFGSGSPVL